MTEAEKAIAEVREWQAKYGDLLIDIAKTVFGNGQPGLKDRMTAVEIKQAECPARKWSHPSFILAAGSLIVAVVVAFIKT